MYGLIDNTCDVSLQGYTDFVDRNSLPALFMEANACQSHVTEDVNGPLECCWPQIYIGSGVWAYYFIELDEQMQKEFVNSNFFGEAIRNKPIGQYYIVGDITSHF